ncbi:nickel ABC transporter ATP-binding protein NikE [Tahibacter amnicola]|uniref:ABC transporter ATP-binding protein n=1 Tax=Tahibacter amnicola TaxID=2976241 RepID=A0ABY6BIN5_9GAMM|nr:ABC transporter ATP-binding protein [Tahibacter amnicola]UXI68486.1 ABC transporter ATP-binding protein [Tahibacter amnicola]
MTALLDVRGLTIHLPGQARPAVDQVDIALAPGECLALVGASGSGKSLTSTAVLGLLPPQARWSGHIAFAGTPLRAADSPEWLAARRNGMAMVWQDALASLHPLRRVGAQLVEIIRISQGLDRRAAALQAAGLLAQVGIDRPADRLRAYPHALSGGQRQRVMIALALAARPRLLIADEATSALDATVQAQVVALLQRLRRELGLALLFVTHDIDLAQGLADRVAVMAQGRIVEQGPVRSVFAAPTATQTRALLEGGIPERESHVTATSAIVLRIQQLSASYPEGGLLSRRRRAVLRDVALHVAAGETLAIVGESGSGKSTLARCLLGLTRADRGVIEVQGQRLDLGGRPGWTAMRQQVQMVFQDPYASLDPRWRVGAIVAEPLRMMQHGRSGESDTVAALLQAVGMDPALATRHPHALSGGQRQRVAIARALACRPHCLVLDEATSALDMSVQKQILAVFQSLQRERGLALLMITHDLHLAARFADRVGVLHQGELVECGPAAEVLTSPRHAQTKALLAARFRLTA